MREEETIGGIPVKERTVLREEMRRDLIKVYKEVYANCPIGTTQTEVYEQVVRHPAQRFYLDPRRAHQIISPMMRGDYSLLERLSPLKRQRYYDLYDVVMRLSQKKGFWKKSLYCIIREAVMEPAPRFYIESKRMEQIWKEEKLMSLQCNKKHHRHYERKVD